MPILTDIFRSIFGPPKERLDANDLPGDIQEDFENLYGRRGPVLHQQLEPPEYHEAWRIYDGLNPEHGDHGYFFQSTEGDFIQEFEHMFQNIFGGFLADFNSPTQDLPPDSQSEVPQDNFSQGSRSLRDRMLKSPDSSLDNDDIKDQHGGSQIDGRHPSLPPFSLFGDFWKLPFGGLRHLDERADIDLDNEVKMGTHSLDDILAKKGDGQLPQCISQPSSSSFSSVTIVDSNGISETKTTRRDSSGKEEVTVTRRIGDQLHTVTRRKDSCGNEETEEDTVNMDSEKLPYLSDGSASNRQSSVSSIVESLMEHFFPKRR